MTGMSLLMSIVDQIHVSGKVVSVDIIVSRTYEPKISTYLSRRFFVKCRHFKQSNASSQVVS